MKTLVIWILVILLLLSTGVAAYQNYQIQEMQYLIDLYEQQPQKIWA